MSNDVATIEAPKRRDAIAVIDPIPLLDTSRFEHMQRVATVMAHASLIPDTLKGQSFEQTLGNCFLVVNQAVRWGMDPFAVAQCMSIVHGKPCYEGKLIAAVIETKLGIQLEYEWFGTPGTDGYGIRITDPRNPSHKVEGTVAEWRTYNKDRTTVNGQWVGGANQKRMLKYRGDREWARMWASALMLGVYSDEELDELADDARARRATPVSSGLTSRLTAQPAANGFSHAHIEAALGTAAETDKPAQTKTPEASPDNKGSQLASQESQQQSSSGDNGTPAGQAVSVDATNMDGSKPQGKADVAGSVSSDQAVSDPKPAAAAAKPAEPEMSKAEAETLINELSAAYAKCKSEDECKAITDSFSAALGRADAKTKATANGIKRTTMGRIRDGAK